ncbi:conserved exported hypothetical protein [Paraburkholderia ribeironis]|uniref:Uncharacterized protein n=1 Tax=Paraburkholderia ribeironis TaxID=1247936 RepID=A0A1N7SHW9_9BURK|nr:hypothetical protein [Paraburkholderia ribeironis]SIT46983.1 conserved exported hypothetical protein [Paraburkholderia ribeironis]
MESVALKLRFACTLVLLTISLMPFGNAFSQAVLAPKAPSAQTNNALALAATGVGVKQCLPALTSLSALGIRDSNNNDVLLDWDRKRPSKSSVFSLIGLEYPSDSAAMSITAVPEADGSCSVAAERISFAPIVCKRVAQQELQGYQATQLLNRMVVYVEAREPGSSVSLIDAPPGCLVIRRYVKFSAATPGVGK